MERSRLAPEDSFWAEIRDQFDEGAAREALDARIAQQERAISLAGRILTLRNMPGFDDFRKALQDMRDHAVNQLSTTTGSDSWMRVLQGQVQAYENLLGVMSKGEQRRAALEQGLRELQNQRQLLDRPRQARQ